MALAALAVAWAGCAAPPGEQSATVLAVDSWSFRGTPTSWGTSAMTASSATMFTTCQTFAGVSDPRFKTASAQSFTITGIRNGTYRDAVTGRVVAVSNSTLSFTVNGSSAGIYVLDGPGKIGSDGDFLR